MVTKVKFVKKLPPLRAVRGGSRGAAWREMLRLRPGEWALVYTAAAAPRAYNMVAQYLQAKRYVGQYEIERRGLEVYARYIGEPVK